MAKRRRNVRMVRNKAETLWVTDVSNFVFTAANEIIQTLICAGSDWERQASSSETATVLAIKGFFYAHTADGTPAVGTHRLTMLVTVEDEDSPAHTATGSSVIDDENTMFVFATGGRDDAGDTQYPGFMANAMPINIKTKRKIRNGESVDVTVNHEVQSGTGSIIRVGWVLRTLIKVS